MCLRLFLAILGLLAVGLSSSAAQDRISNLVQATKPPPCCQNSAPTPPAPWKGLFFNNDFSYKNNCCAPYLFGEEWKELPLDVLNGESRLSVGANIRKRRKDVCPNASGLPEH